MEKNAAWAIALSACLVAPWTLAGCSQSSQESNATQEVASAEPSEEIAEAAEEEAVTEMVEVAEESAAKEADSAAESASSNYDNLASWGIKVAVPAGTTSVLKGNTYYIYTEHDGTLPYIMLTCYTINTDEQGFLNQFTDYMKGSYNDLTVTEQPAPVKIGDKDCWKVVYSYSIQGHPATDTRVLVMKDGIQYLFGTKDISELGITAGPLFEQVIKDAVISGRSS